MNSIKSLIIDDDPFVQDLLRDKLSQHLTEVEVLAVASSGADGLQKIALLQPGLVFLDVEMADMTGFEMLAQLPEINFQTIFITSYSHYAIKAIRFNALDYLLKPIDLGELRKAIARYRTKLKEAGNNENLELALRNMKTADVADHQLVLQTQEGEMRLVVKNIVRIEGERNYSYIHLKNGKKKLVTKTLAGLEELMVEKGFFRCHRSHLINYRYIKNIQNSISLVLSDGVEIPIARRKKESFKQWLMSGR
jgi:two-component system LytT family response regulator